MFPVAVANESLGISDIAVLVRPLSYKDSLVTHYYLFANPSYVLVH
jgi:hypothetical protein